MGATDVQAYINTPGVRSDSSQYYHNRNLTIKPQNSLLQDSVAVRFYFLESETESLINATGCPACTKPSSAYELGIPKYSDIDDAVENGTIADNNKGIWSFITPAQAVKVPFDKGYYAEFKVRNFSEFWLKKENFNRTNPPLTQLINFRANKKENNDVLAEWSTTVAGYASRFEIELAKGNQALQANSFMKIGEVASAGNTPQPQAYSFNDAEANKSGVRYYRLKIINTDGTFFYSGVKAVLFTEELTWQVYPNPSPGLFYLVYQLNEGERISLRISDMSGKVINQLSSTATGFIQKVNISMDSRYASGVYLVEVVTGEKKKIFRLLKL